MKACTLILGTLLMSAPAFAAASGGDFRCTVGLVQPMDDAGIGLWLPSESPLVVFDYDPATEKTVNLAVKVAVPPRPVQGGGDESITQYALVQVASAKEADLAIEFSKLSPDGSVFTGRRFGYYLRLKTDFAWALGNETQVQYALHMPINEKVKGYAVLTCVKK